MLATLILHYLTEKYILNEMKQRKENKKKLVKKEGKDIYPKGDFYCTLPYWKFKW